MRPKFITFKDEPRLKEEFLVFYNSIQKSETEINELIALHYKIKDIIQAKDFDKLRRFFMYIIQEDSDVNVLKSSEIAIRMHSGYEKQPLKEIYDTIYDHCDRKIQALI